CKLKKLSYAVFFVICANANANAKPVELDLKEYLTSTNKILLKSNYYGLTNNPYEIKYTLGKPQGKDVILRFSNVNLSQEAYIEVSDSKRQEIYLYGYKDYGNLKNGEYFYPITISDSYANVRVVYPENIDIKQDEEVLIEAFTTSLSDAIISDGIVCDTEKLGCHGLVNKIDDREHTSCVLEKYPDWRAASLSTAKSYFYAGGPYAKVGTAFSVGNDNHIVSNYHVINDKNPLSGYELRFQLFGSGCNNLSPDNVIKYKLGKYISGYMNDAQYDDKKDHSLSAINSFDYKNTNFKYLFGGVKLKEERPENGTSTYVPQFGYNYALRPEGVQLNSYIKGNQACFIFGYDPSGPSSMRHNCDTPPGASGSPMLSQNTNEMVGLVWAMSNQFNMNYSIFSDIVFNDFKSFIGDSNVAISGTGHVILKQFNIEREGLDLEAIYVSEDSYFDSFTGELQHYDGYSTLTVNGESVTNGNQDKFTYRLIQKGEDNIEYNLSKVLKNKKLIVKILKSDNEVYNKGPFKTWLGLKVKNAYDNSLINNILIKVNNTIEFDQPGTGIESIHAQASMNQITGAGSVTLSSTIVDNTSEWSYQWNHVNTTNSQIISPNLAQTLVKFDDVNDMTRHIFNVTASNKDGRVIESNDVEILQYPSNAGACINLPEFQLKQYRPKEEVQFNGMHYIADRWTDIKYPDQPYSGWNLEGPCK
ncbi:hypothetical protein NMR64_003850, partial [Vibrio cholerae]|nr:hypothetical protein [Vibrio cholerae]